MHEPSDPEPRVAWSLDALATSVLTRMAAESTAGATSFADGLVPAEILLASGEDGIARHMKAGIVVLPPGFVGTPHTHDAEELTVCVQGMATMAIGERRVAVTAGTVLWTPADEIHWAEVAVGDEACVLLYAYAPLGAPITRLPRAE